MTAITDWDTLIRDGDEDCKAGEVELRDIARGFAGALFVSLPLLFTMEMWSVARTIPDWVLLIFLGFSFILNKLYLDFAGFRRCAWQRSKWWDAAIAMGIGVVASLITLLVTGTIKPDLNFYLSLKLVAIETIATSLGASVAINQLGSGDSAQDGTGLSVDMKVIVGSLLGGFLFALNIAPTVEPKVIVLQQNWYLTGATLFLSLAVSYLTVAIAAFDDRNVQARKIISSEWFEAVFAYLIAFAISAVLLWVFGFATPFDPIDVWLPQAIALAYVTALGGAAGRLVL